MNSHSHLLTQYLAYHTATEDGTKYSAMEASTYPVYEWGITCLVSERSWPQRMTREMKETQKGTPAPRLPLQFMALSRQPCRLPVFAYCWRVTTTQSALLIFWHMAPSLWVSHNPIHIITHMLGYICRTQLANEWICTARLFDVYLIVIIDYFDWPWWPSVSAANTIRVEMMTSMTTSAAVLHWIWPCLFGKREGHSDENWAVLIVQFFVLFFIFSREDCAVKGTRG